MTSDLAGSVGCTQIAGSSGSVGTWSLAIAAWTRVATITGGGAVPASSGLLSRQAASRTSEVIMDSVRRVIRHASSSASVTTTQRPSLPFHLRDQPLDAIGFFTQPLWIRRGRVEDGCGLEDFDLSADRRRLRPSEERGDVHRGHGLRRGNLTRLVQFGQGLYAGDHNRRW